MTQEYRVSWVIQVDADNSEQAAIRARNIQLDPKSLATSFEITLRCPNCKQFHYEDEIEVDLMEGSRDH
jgi:hypothetical protein